MEKDYSPQKSLRGGAKPVASLYDIDDAYRSGKNHEDRIQKAAERIAQDMGHTGKITISKEPHEFELDGKKRKAAGTYHANNGEIKLYSDHVWGAEALERVLAHEIGHHRFEVVQRLAHQETKRLVKNPHHLAALNNNQWHPEMDKEYPHTGLFIKHMGIKSTEPNILDESDGVTDYTKSWWAAHKAGDADRMQAIDETHADIVALHQKELREAQHHLDYADRPPGLTAHEMAEMAMLSKHKIHPSWLDMHRDIHSAYAAHEHKRALDLIMSLNSLDKKKKVAKK